VVNLTNRPSIADAGLPARAPLASVGKAVWGALATPEEVAHNATMEMGGPM